MNDGVISRPQPAPEAQAAAEARADWHRLSIRVYFEDTDVSGVVYHANYLRWLERGRSEWLRGLGFAQSAFMDAQGIAFTIANLSLDFLQPARLDDVIEVCTRPQRMRRASIDFAQEIRLGERCLLRATVRVAAVDKVSFRPAALPASLRTQPARGKLSE